MKKLSTTIAKEDGTPKVITVCVDDQTATALEQCTEEFRQMYILDEYEEQKLTHTETRRIVSYEQITESGFDITDPEKNPMEMLVSREVDQRLYAAMDNLTEKQYHILWRHAVDGLTYEEIAAEMGIRWDTVRGHYHAAVKKVRKFF